MPENPGGENTRSLDVKFYALEGCEVKWRSEGAYSDSYVKITNLLTGDQAVWEGIGTNSTVLEEGLYQLEVYWHFHSSGWDRLAVRVEDPALILEHSESDAIHEALYVLVPEWRRAYYRGPGAESFNVVNATGYAVYTGSAPKELKEGFEALRQAMLQIIQTSANLASTLWSFYRAHGWYSYEDIPEGYKVMPVDAALPPSESWLGLDSASLLALYAKWLELVNKTFVETPFNQTGVMDAGDVDFTELEYLIKGCEVYFPNGTLYMNLTGWQVF